MVNQATRHSVVRVPDGIIRLVGEAGFFFFSGFELSRYRVDGRVPQAAQGSIVTADSVGEPPLGRILVHQHSGESQESGTEATPLPLRHELLEVNHFEERLVERREDRVLLAQSDHGTGEHLNLRLSARFDVLEH